MSLLGWTADGMQRARDAGGIELELYRRPGFTGEMAVRQVRLDVASGSGISLDPEPDEYEDGYRGKKRSK